MAPDVAEQAGGRDAGRGEVRGERVAGGVAADGGEERDRVAEAGERQRDVERDPARAALDAARHVGAVGQRRGGPADDVPERGSGAEDRLAGGHQAGANRSLR